MIAGSDTTFVSLQWLLLAMAAYPKVQEKLHQELDAVLGKNCSIPWLDRRKLPYCLATIMEGMRWRTVVPLNLLHRYVYSVKILITSKIKSYIFYLFKRKKKVLSFFFSFPLQVRGIWCQPGIVG